MNGYFFFIKTCLAAATGQKFPKQVLSDLFHKFSYRYNEQHKGSYKSLVRYFVYAIRLICKNKGGKLSDSTLVVYDGSAGSAESRNAYLKQLGYQPSIFISRDNLPNNLSFLSKVNLVIGLVLTTLLVLPVWLVRSDRTKVALILLEVAEAGLFLATLKVLKANQTFIFSAYEKDVSFLCYYITKETEIKISLFPSPNPIRFYYQTVICDTFCFSAPFQKFEFEELKDKWRVKSTILLPPPGFEEIEVYKENPITQNVIGFISSGGHLRKSLHHTNNFEDADLKAEEATLLALKKIHQKKGHPVLIYLHPIEKKVETTRTISIRYYKDIFGEEVQFAPFDQPSKKNFGLCHVAVAGFSSAQIERLYGGHKTLFSPMGFLPDYFRDPRLKSISANTQEELIDLVADAFGVSTQEFFDKHALGEYTYLNTRN